MLKGKLFYDFEDEQWSLDIGNRAIDVSSLINELVDLKGFFPDIDKCEGEGETIEIIFKIKN